MRSLKINFPAATPELVARVDSRYRMVLCGFAYWWPVAGYAVRPKIFGWLLILADISVQLYSGDVRGHRFSRKGWDGGSARRR